ncbi:hypothetical protein MIR68_012003 [Amoeboaphelidium protococcarum]|nr:hypothetical protein MIR68_012003 [Amoeboaphelidium protococcarum]
MYQTHKSEEELLRAIGQSTNIAQTPVASGAQPTQSVVGGGVLPQQSARRRPSQQQYQSAFGSFFQS